MKHSRIVCFSLLVIAALLLLTGCGSDNAAPPERDADIDALNTESPHKPSWEGYIEFSTEKIEELSSAKRALEFNYEDYTTQASVGKEIILGKTDSYDKAVKNAEAAMAEFYFEREIDGQKPFIVYYDSGSKIWLVTGSFYQTIKELEEAGQDINDYVFAGGVINVLIREEDGEVLAIWGEE